MLSELCIVTSIKDRGEGYVIVCGGPSLSESGVVMCVMITTVDCEIFVVIIVDDLFRRKLNTQNILRNIHRPIPILIAKVWRLELDYMKNLQAKYFIGENIPIYGNYKE